MTYPACDTDRDEVDLPRKSNADPICLDRIRGVRAREHARDAKRSARGTQRARC